MTDVMYLPVRRGETRCALVLTIRILALLVKCLRLVRGLASIIAPVLAPETRIFALSVFAKLLVNTKSANTVDLLSLPVRSPPVLAVPPQLKVGWPLTLTRATTK